MPTSVGPNTFGEENLVFGYDTGDTVNSFPGIPAVNCARVPTTSGNGVSKGNWSVTEVTDGSITPPRKGARVFKFVAGTTSNLYRQSGYYYGGGFTANNTGNSLILGRTSPSNFTTVSEANKYRWGFWVRGVESNNAGWNFAIDIGDRNIVSYTVGNSTDWYFISTVNTDGTNSNGYPYDFFDIFTSNQGLTLYIADMGIMRSPGTVDSLPILQAYPQWVEYEQERNYTSGLRDLTSNSTIDISNSSFTSDALTAFDGSGDYFDLGADQVFKSSGGWTVESVVNYDSVAGGYNNLTSPANFIGSDTTQYNSWYWSVLSNKLALWNINPGVWKYGSTTLQPNTWYHTALVCSNDGTSYQMYLNGVAEGGDHTTYSWNASYAGLRVRYIGAGRSTLRYVNGTIPITKLYSRALTASEIKANYNAIKGRFNI